MLLPDSSANSESLASYNLSADDISVSAGQYQQISVTNLRLFNNDNTSDVTNNNLNRPAKNTDKDVIPNYYNFKKVLIKDLELYGGPFEITINVTNSTRPLYLPTSSSYNDYIAMSIPKDFDMTVKFSDSNSTHAQLEMMKKNDKNSFQRIKVSGYNNDSIDNGMTGQILFHNVRVDVKSIRYITALMKNPEINIINEVNRTDTDNPVDEDTSSLQFRKNSAGIAIQLN